MTQHDPDQRSPTPPAARIAARRVAGRTWVANYEGPGCGCAWGVAIATLDYRSHSVTPGPRPTFWIDEDELRRLVVEVGRIGVRIDAVDGSTLPAARVR